MGHSGSAIGTLRDHVLLRLSQFELAVKMIVFNKGRSLAKALATELQALQAGMA
jgi:hypothetical protein